MPISVLARAHMGSKGLIYIYIYMVTSRLFVYRFCASSVRFLFFTLVCVFLHAARYAYYVKYMCSAMATFLTFFCSELHGNNRCRVHHCFCFLSWLRLLEILRAYNVVIFVHTNDTKSKCHKCNNVPWERCFHTHTHSSVGILNVCSYPFGFSEMQRIH